MEKKIIDYLLEQKVLTIATCKDNQPYCANCFYVFDETTKTLIFLSDDSTRHIRDAIQNNSVGGSIQNGVTIVSKIQGIQFMGEFISPNETQKEAFYELFYDKFLFAKVRPSPIWGIQLNWIKMTDNTLGFGKKMLWER